MKHQLGKITPHVTAKALREAEKLLIKTWLIFSRLVSLDWPEAGTVGREDFVDQKQVAMTLVAVLKFRVGDDNSPFTRVI